MAGEEMEVEVGGWDLGGRKVRGALLSGLDTDKKIHLHGAPDHYVPKVKEPCGSLFLLERPMGKSVIYAMI